MIFLLAVLLAVPLAAEPLSENQARFGVIKGDVGLLTQGAENWIEPHEGLPIEPGDHIRTGEDGSAEIIPVDQALWVLEPESEAVVEHTETRTGRLDLPSGSLTGKVDSARSAGVAQRWEFNTPAAVAVVQGTEFAIQASRAEGTRLGVFEGSVDMEPAETAEGVQPTVEVTSGHEADARKGLPIQIAARFSPPMAALAAQRAALRRRQSTIENTWTPFTPSVRAELRRRFVAPAAKHKTIRRVAPRKRRAPSQTPVSTETSP